MLKARTIVAGRDYQSSRVLERLERVGIVMDQQTALVRPGVPAFGLDALGSSNEPVEPRLCQFNDRTDRGPSP
jgi:hypothetical protein